MKVLRKQRKRLYEILRRHVRDTDALKTDHQFATEVLDRYLRSKAAVLVDPAE